MSGRDVWSRFSSDPRARAAGDLRATDADRDVVLEVLSIAYSEGRLDREEYDTRSDTALALRTLGEVRPLVGDLVALPAVRGAGQEVREEAMTTLHREVHDARLGFLVVSGATVAIWGVSALVVGWHFFWPALPIAVLGAGWLASHWGTESRLETLEQEIRERRRRDRP